MSKVIALTADQQALDVKAVRETQIGSEVATIRKLLETGSAPAALARAKYDVKRFNDARFTSLANEASGAIAADTPKPVQVTRAAAPATTTTATKQPATPAAATTGTATAGTAANGAGTTDPQGNTATTAGATSGPVTGGGPTPNPSVDTSAWDDPMTQ
jgi:hypothetical protein